MFYCEVEEQPLRFSFSKQERLTKEIAMEEKVCAWFGDQSWSETIGYCMSSDGGAWNKRKKKFAALKI
ncbi:hypothetical protein PIB30_076270, partial [Stylosanthes scabra]|nr:hypothetical protein [Stylosanthes scabra]